MLSIFDLWPQADECWDWISCELAAKRSPVFLHRCERRGRSLYHHAHSSATIQTIATISSQKFCINLKNIFCLSRGWKKCHCVKMNDNKELLILEEFYFKKRRKKNLLQKFEVRWTQHVFFSQTDFTSPFNTCFNGNINVLLSGSDPFSGLQD